MNNRERFNAIMHYENYDRMPVVHFGYWDELLEKWMQEGHITKEERMTYGDGMGHAVQIGTTLAASVITSSENVCPRFLPAELGLNVTVE